MVGPVGIRGRYVVAGFAFGVPYVAQGVVLRKEMGRDVPKIVRLLIGNPLIMKDMAKHVPDAGSYAPVTVLLDEVRTAFTFPMTALLVFSRPTVTATHSGSLKIWTQKLRRY